MFLFALIFGAGQVCLTERLIEAFGSRNSKRILLFFTIKFLLYALGIALVIFKYVWNIDMAVSGFTVGVPVTAIALFVYCSIYKK